MGFGKRWIDWGGAETDQPPSVPKILANAPALTTISQAGAVQSVRSPKEANPSARSRPSLIEFVNTDS